MRMTRAFDGVRVIDFSQVLAGPFCTFQLGLLGATVVKVENPKGGDQMRRMMADARFPDIGLSPAFCALNAGKRSMTLDLNHPREVERSEARRDGNECVRTCRYGGWQTH